MNPIKFMFVAGEPSGDLLAAGLVRALRDELSRRASAAFAPVFFGAGGHAMREAGVETVVDMTAHSVIGISDVFRKIGTFAKFLRQLRRLAVERQPDVIVCVDFSGFNRRLGHAIKKDARDRHLPWFRNWLPKLVQFVSPQVWASRPGRALKMREDFDLVLSIFPFEKEWYAKNAPGLRVEFVGHPLVERYENLFSIRPVRTPIEPFNVLLLPGSRRGELKRHLPVLCDSIEVIRKRLPETRVLMVLPNADLARLAEAIGIPCRTEVIIGDLPRELLKADVALASTGTVTMECALLGVPTVAFYKTSRTTYQVGRRIVKVRYLAMPNILADEVVFPEFVQNDATGINIGECAVELLKSAARREEIRTGLKRVTESLGGPGALRNAAGHVLGLIG